MIIFEPIWSSVVALGSVVIWKLVDAVCELFHNREQPELPQEYLVDFNEFENKKISASRTIIKQCFGDNIVDCFKNASNIDRIHMADNFAKRLAREYGLDITIDIAVDDAKAFGYYNEEKKKAVFNIVLIASDKANENFDYCVRETIDTIIHELRHAVQYHAINNPGFWNISDEHLNSWRNNRKNYIRPEVDLKSYASQPIEKDAFSFASAVMKGLC